MATSQRDEGSRWVQITSGRGPAECQWAVAQVLKTFCREAEAAGIAVEPLASTPGEQPGTYLSVLLSVDGEEAAVEAFVAGWSGTIQWIERSPFRPQHRRRNWFVGVDSLREPVLPRWSERDLRFTTMRSSGPGGQHVNKTESAVRVVHVPTGLSAVAREERSQGQNRRLALARLAGLMEAQGQQALAQSEQALWDQHNELVRGDAVRVYEGGARPRRVR